MLNIATTGKASALLSSLKAGEADPMDQSVKRVVQWLAANWPDKGATLNVTVNWDGSSLAIIIAPVP